MVALPPSIGSGSRGLTRPHESSVRITAQSPPGWSSPQPAAAAAHPCPPRAVGHSPRPVGIPSGGHVPGMTYHAGLAAANPSHLTAPDPPRFKECQPGPIRTGGSPPPRSRSSMTREALPGTRTHAPPAFTHTASAHTSPHLKNRSLAAPSGRRDATRPPGAKSTHSGRHRAVGRWETLRSSESVPPGQTHYVSPVAQMTKRRADELACKPDPVGSNFPQLLTTNQVLGEQR